MNRRGGAAPTPPNPPHVIVGAIGEAGRDYVQDERYIAMEHMDVRRDWFRFAQGLKESPRGRGSYTNLKYNPKNNLRNLRNLRIILFTSMRPASPPTH